MINFLRRHIVLLAVGVTCAAAGAGASVIAAAGAASSPHPRATAAHRLTLRRLARRTVAGSLVVRTKRGYVNVQIARGLVKQVSGQQLTLAEGTPRSTYRTVTLTLPAHTRVRDNRQPSTLAQVKPGQRAIVLIAPKRAFLVARTPR
jgi:hypothetical protein